MLKHLRPMHRECDIRWKALDVRRYSCAGSHGVPGSCRRSGRPSGGQLSVRNGDSSRLSEAGSFTGCGSSGRRSDPVKEPPDDPPAPDRDPPDQDKPRQDPARRDSREESRAFRPEPIRGTVE
jgi:hypothetical protein